MTDTETHLPPGWTKVALGTVSREPDQHVPAADETFSYIDIGSIDRTAKVIREPQRMLGKDAPSRARKKVATGDTLVSMTRPNLNAVALVPDALDGQIASTGFDVLRPAHGIDPRWLAYLVRTDEFVGAMSELVQGALYPAVRTKDVRGFVAPLAPAAEQIRIADQLDSLLARIQACQDRLEAIPALLKRFRQAVLTAATSGHLTDDWREAQCASSPGASHELDAILRDQSGHLRIRGEAARVAREQLYEVPESWAWVLNHQLAVDDSNAICAGPFGTIFKAKDFRDKGVPIIFLRHIGDGNYLTHKPGFMDAQVWQKLHQPYSVFGGELLVAKLGDPPGTACIYPTGIGTAMVTPDVMKMSVNSKAAKSRYLMHFFNSPNSKKIVEALCYGVTRLRIDLSMFKTFPIPLPPRLEQAEIVRRVDALFAFADRLEARLQSARNAAQRLTPALLAKAFRGDLVPQDANDEPASALLARIATQRKAPKGAAAASTPRRGRPPRAPKEAATMTKSRQDDDVMGQPYLAGHLRHIGTPASAEALFKVAELPVADFYKQLAWEVAQGHVKDNQTTLEPGHAAG